MPYERKGKCIFNKETGKRGSSAIDRSMGGNMEEAKEEEKKEEDK